MLYCLPLSCSGPFFPNVTEADKCTIVFPGWQRASITQLSAPAIERNTVFSVKSCSSCGDFHVFIEFFLRNTCCPLAKIPSDLRKSKEDCADNSLRFLLLRRGRLKRFYETETSGIDVTPCHLNVLADERTIRDKPVGMVSICFTCSLLLLPLSSTFKKPSATCGLYLGSVCYSVSFNLHIREKGHCLLACFLFDDWWLLFLYHLQESKHCLYWNVWKGTKAKRTALKNEIIK